MASVLREPTEAEKQNYVDIMKPAFDIKFVQILRKKEYEYAKKLEPFCRRCARVDFDDSIARLKLDIARQRGQKGQEKIESEIDIGNLDKYAKKERFELIMESEAFEQIYIGPGRREPKLTGYNVEYKCNVRGCNLTINMPLDKYEEWKNKQKKKEEIK